MQRVFRSSISTYLVACLATLLFCPALPAAADQDSDTGNTPNQVRAVRSSASSQRTRIVVDTQGPPLYQVYTTLEPSCLVIDVLDTTGTPRPGKPPAASLVSNWKVENPTIRLFRFTVGLKAPLPNDQYAVQVLDKPNRLVVDLNSSWVKQETYQLTPSVTWIRREHVGGDYGYLLWNQLEVDPTQPTVAFDIGLANGNMRKCQPLSKIVGDTGALAGVNGGYFNPAGGALGIVVREGKILSPHVSRRPPRTTLAMNADGSCKFARALVANGQLRTITGQNLGNTKLALGGGPNLLTNGAFNLTTDAEELGPKGNDITRSCARTAVGTTSTGKVIIATASGYSSNHAQGVKLPQMARLLYSAGARNAMNLDGGGSVDMAIRGNIVANGPEAGTYERPIATALLINDSAPSTFPARVSFYEPPKTLPADGTTKTTIAVKLTTENDQPVPDGTSVTFRTQNLTCQTTTAYTKNGIATLEVTTIRRPSRALIVARSGFARTIHTIDLIPAEPSSIIVDVLRNMLSPATSPSSHNASDRYASSTGNRTNTADATLSGDNATGGNNADSDDDATGDNADSNDNATGYNGDTNGDNNADSNDDNIAPTSDDNDDTPTKASGPTRKFWATLLVEDKWHNGIGYTPVKVRVADQDDLTLTTDYNGEIDLRLDLPASASKITLVLENGYAQDVPLPPLR